MTTPRVGTPEHERRQARYDRRDAFLEDLARNGEEPGFLAYMADLLTGRPLRFPTPPRGSKELPFRVEQNQNRHRVTAVGWADFDCGPGGIIEGPDPRRNRCADALYGSSDHKGMDAFPGSSL